ncbi:MAG: hypothetical protein NVSMB60_22540 [Mycobacterium sp.]
MCRPALGNPARGFGSGGQGVALDHRDGPVALCENPGGQQAARARAQNYRLLTSDRHRPPLNMCSVAANGPGKDRFGVAAKAH